MFQDEKRPGPRRRAIRAICGGIFLFGTGAWSAFAQSTDSSAIATQGIGTVREVTGTGGLGRQDPLPMMQPGMDIFTGDRARTEAESRAHLAFGRQTEVFLGPKSELIIDAFIAGSGALIYLDGSLLFDRVESEPDAEAEVVTEYGRIGVRGTRFFVALDEDGLGVFVARGEVSVTGNDPASTTVLLGAGDGTLIPSSGRPPNPANRWTDQRIAKITHTVLGEAVAKP